MVSVEAVTPGHHAPCRLPDLPVARRDHVAVALDRGRAILVCGGSTMTPGNSSRLTSRCDLLDPSSIAKGWIRVSDLPEALAGAGVAAVKDKVYVVGGRTEKEEASDKVYVYDQVSERVRSRLRS